LELNQCHLQHGLELAKAEATSISLQGSYLRSRLSARELRVVHTLNLSGGFRGFSTIDLRGARIGSRLYCNDATFGKVMLAGAEVGAGFSCAKSSFTNEYGPALIADRLTVGGACSLLQAEFVGGLAFRLGHIGGAFGCTGATFTNQRGPALNAIGLVVDAEISLRDTNFNGETRLQGARVGRFLDCSNASFTNKHGIALAADRLTIGSELIISQGKFTGAVQLRYGRVGGSIVSGIDLSGGATFANGHKTALDANGLVVEADLLLDQGTEFDGEVNLAGAHIGRNFDCTQAKFHNPGDAALTADRIRVDGDMIFSQGTSFDGQVNLPGAEIGGSLDCTDATFNNPHGVALYLERATVEHAAKMFPSMFTGKLDLRHAKVGVAGRDEDMAEPKPSR
jgi:hypothetical protein